MNWAILELYCGESGKLGYYNSQELGLARALASKNVNVTIVYPDKKEKVQQQVETEEQICVLKVPYKTIGVHAFYNLDFLVERKNEYFGGYVSGMYCCGKESAWSERNYRRWDFGIFMFYRRRDAKDYLYQ